MKNNKHVDLIAEIHVENVHIDWKKLDRQTDSRATQVINC